MVVSIIIFCLTYTLIAARRLTILPIGRSAGALLGAVLMVFCGVITTEESFLAINHDTILLLFATMLLTVYLSEAHFFSLLSSWILLVCKTPLQLLFFLSFVSAVFSAFLVNDTACLFLTPIIVAICRQNKLPMGPYLICLATSANIGSAATLVGNPQNMIIGSYSKIAFSYFFIAMLPVVIVCLVINFLLLYAFFRKKIPAHFIIKDQEKKKIEFSSYFYYCCIVVTLVLIGFFTGFPLGYTALAGCLVIIIFQQKDPYESFVKVDWPLLIMFCGLFIVTSGVAKTGIIKTMWEWSHVSSDFTNIHNIFLFSGFLTFGSQIVSNVPMVLLAIPYMESISAPTAWFYLAFVTTTAGNLTLLGSVANIIVAEIAKSDYDLTFWEYFRFGFISTAILIPVGVAIIFFLN